MEVLMEAIFLLPFIALGLLATIALIKTPSTPFLWKLAAGLFTVLMCVLCVWSIVNFASHMAYMRELRSYLL
jgi:hypothetical protein